MEALISDKCQKVEKSGILFLLSAFSWYLKNWVMHIEKIAGTFVNDEFVFLTSEETNERESPYDRPIRSSSDNAKGCSSSPVITTYKIFRISGTHNVLSFFLT